MDKKEMKKNKEKEEEERTKNQNQRRRKKDRDQRRRKKEGKTKACTGYFKRRKTQSQTPKFDKLAKIRPKVVFLFKTK